MEARGTVQRTAVWHKMCKHIFRNIPEISNWFGGKGIIFILCGVSTKPLDQLSRWSFLLQKRFSWCFSNHFWILGLTEIWIRLNELYRPILCFYLDLQLKKCLEDQKCFQWLSMGAWVSLEIGGILYLVKCSFTTSVYSDCWFAWVRVRVSVWICIYVSLYIWMIEVRILSFLISKDMTDMLRYFSINRCDHLKSEYQ